MGINGDQYTTFHAVVEFPFSIDRTGHSVNDALFIGIADSVSGSD